jgi:transposase-like protein
MINMKKAEVKAQGQATVEKIVKMEVSKSQKIKDLFDAGLETKDIAELLQIRYNFAYNVISNYARMNDINVDVTPKTHRKDEIVTLAKTGKSLVEISKELKVNYNYVWKIVKESVK